MPRSASPTLSDPADIVRLMTQDRRQDTERIGMRTAWRYELAQGRTPRDVSGAVVAPRADPNVNAVLRAHAPGLTGWDADLFSTAPDGSWCLIEVKARSRSGPVEVTNREYQTGLALGERH